jgi:hypothetical protein
MKGLLSVSHILAILGCNSAAREQELQQQKLLTELAKTNTESLAELNKKQTELHNTELELTKKGEDFKARENAVQASLDRVKERERELTQRETELAQKVACEEAKIQDEKSTLSKDRERLKSAWSTAQQAIVAKQAELDRLIAIGRQREKAIELARRQAEEYEKSEGAKRAERRRADLERLAELATDLTNFRP